MGMRTSAGARLALIVALVLVGDPCLADGPGVQLTITNPEPFRRAGEIVSIQWLELSALLPSLDPALVAVTTLPEGTPVPVQMGDGELLLSVDMPGGGTKDYRISSGAHPVSPDRKVDGRFVLPRQDYAWENDRIAFRVYGPALAGEVRNGIDVWTKRVRSLIVGKWYRESEGNPPGKDSYHVDRGEGADFFSVGKSLGAGGAALWSGGRIHQPGVFTGWKTLADGPLRVHFELTYDSLDLDGERYREICRVTLDAGSNLNRIEVTYRGKPTEEGLLVACGLVKRAGTVATSNAEEGWLALWGPTTADSIDGMLGTGIVVPASRFVRVAEDSLHHLILGRAEVDTPFVYYAGAGWTRSGDFTSAEDWNRYLSRWARSIASPLKWTIRREDH